MKGKTLELSQNSRKYSGMIKLYSRKYSFHSNASLYTTQYISVTIEW